MKVAGSSEDVGLKPKVGFVLESAADCEDRAHQDSQWLELPTDARKA